MSTLAFLVDTELLNSTLEQTACDLLQQAGIVAPPVDALAIAERLHIEVAFDGGQNSRGRQKKLAGRPSIFLKPDDRPERVQWATAHELGEVVAHRIFESLVVDVDDVEPAQREEVANLFASRLLLPGSWFFEDARSLDGDILQLKKLHPSASHELIALRLLDLQQPSIVTVFDQGRITRRRGNLANKPPRLQPLEQECWQRVHCGNRGQLLRCESFAVTGWAIHEPGWKREILRTVPASDFD